MPGPAAHVSGPGRSDTKNSHLPPTGVGQKSFAAELTGAPRFCGVPQGASLLTRSATQISLPPEVPGRFDARYRLKPSRDSIGQPSLTGVLTFGTAVASCQL